MQAKAGLPVHFSKLILLGLLGLLFLAGCSSIPGYPKPIGIEKYPVKATPVTETPQKTAKEQLMDCPDATCRDKWVFQLIAESDEAFDQFKKDLYKEGVSIGLVGDTLRLGLEAAAAVAGGPGMKSALSATALGIGSFQTTIDKRVFFEQTLMAIIQFMIAKKNEVLVNIYKGLKRPFEEYPPGAALHDIRLYHSAGSIPEALAEVVKEGTAKAEKAKKEVVRVVEAQQIQIEKLLGEVDLLPSGKAWGILQRPPSGLDDYTNSAVEARLENTQLSAAENLLGGEGNDANAKAILRMIIVLMNDRSEENLAKWEAAIISEQ